MTEEGIKILEQYQAPSVIPGLNHSDIIDGTVGMNPGGHSIHDPNDERLLDPVLQARVAYWLRPKAYSLKEIKEECKEHKISREGNKRVLALKLAFRQLPQDMNLLDGLLSTSTVESTKKKSSATTANNNDDKGATGDSTTTTKETSKKPEQSSETTTKLTVAKKKKTTTKSKYPPSFKGCKTCGKTDHNRCTKLKCPLHPEYDRATAGDWSGRSGYKCQLCGRSSEGVGPRRGFDYRNSVCGGCTDLSEL